MNVSSSLLAKLSHWMFVLVLMGTPFVLCAKEHSRVLYVANNGIDSMSCGMQTSPCRSISQAILNAGDGDKIEVGPGIYGDIDGDGDLLSPGEESRANPRGGSLVLVDRRLAIYSQAGAAATVISPPRDGAQGMIVVINAAGSVFGWPDRGFTIAAHQRAGIALWVRGADVRVSGNIARNHGDLGFAFEVSQGPVVATHNVSIGNRVGYVVYGANVNHAAVLYKNVAEGNRESGFWVQGPGAHVLTSNRTARNVVGIELDGGPYKVSHNIVVANSQAGVVSRGASNVMTRNVVAGNSYAGFQFAAGAVNNVLRRNNILGNGAAVSGGDNCGVRNESGTVVDAPQNYWGAPTGPGADPADTACDSGGSQTITTPFATQAFPIH